MRGLASLGVVIFHLSTLGLAVGLLPLGNMITSWNSGVDFFFVLSGFLLSIPFLQQGSKYSLKNYYVKRIFRILPVYYLNILLIGTILILTLHATLLQLVSSFFFAQSLSPATFNSINGVSWTLVIEEIFYVTLPLFSVLFTKNRWRYSLPACLAVSILYREWAVLEFAHSDLSFHLWQYPSFLGHYALGLTLANFYVNRKFSGGKVTSSKPMLASILLLIVTQYFVGSAYGISNNGLVLPGLLFAFEYASLIYFTLSTTSQSTLRKIFDNRLATSLGKISYSLYTWHLPIEIFLLRSGLRSWEWVGLSLFLSLSVAALSYKFVEKPFLRYRDRLLSDKRV